MDSRIYAGAQLLTRALVLAAAVFLTGHALGADAVVKDVILLGQTADKKGGVFGRRIELVSKDDAYVIDRSVSNARDLVDKNNVFMIFATVGTENFKAVEEKVTTPAKVPLFAPSSGAEILRAPYKRYVFPVRAGYHAEMEKIIQHLTTVGIKRVSIFYDDDAFGKDILVGVERALAKRNLKIHSQAAVDREGKLIAEAVKKIGPTQPEAMIVGSAGGTALKFVREMLKQGYEMPMYLDSGINVGSLTKNWATRPGAWP
jgi:branched-chain amino acid transport system substrate-binding protein